MSGWPSLRSLPDRVRALPPGRRRLVQAGAAVGYFALCYGVLLVLYVLLADQPVDWTRPTGSMVGAVIGAVAGRTLAVRQQRRRVGGRARQRELTAAMRTGRLPTGADPTVWAPVLAGEQRVQRRSARIAAVLTAGGVLVVLLVAVGNTSAPELAVVLGAIALAAAVVVASIRRAQRRLARLADQLPSGPPAG